MPNAIAMRRACLAASVKKKTKPLGAPVLVGACSCTYQCAQACTCAHANVLPERVLPSSSTGARVYVFACCSVQSTGRAACVWLADRVCVLCVQGMALQGQQPMPTAVLTVENWHKQRLEVRPHAYLCWPACVARGEGARPSCGVWRGGAR